MKIGIVTISDYYNHGNRLQNYAIQSLMESAGHEVVTYGMFPRAMLGVLYPTAMGIFPYIPVFTRMWRFKKFTAKHYDSVRIDFYTKKKLDALNARHDAFIVGSDQVWNPAYMFKPYAYFLQFCDPHKRIAYAPSFGVSHISPRWQKRFAEALKDFPHLSVREDAGAKIIYEASGKNCPVHLDPTLLLTREQWLKFTAKPRNMPKGKYLLTYFLMPKKEYKREARRLAKAYGLKLVEISQPFGKYYKSNPSEFLYLMEHAELICTNSFHGHALSIALEKPFVSFSSVSHMVSRITTLLSFTGLENRNYKTIDPQEYFTLDYTAVNEALRARRAECIDYLMTALESAKRTDKDNDCH